MRGNKSQERRQSADATTAAIVADARTKKQLRKQAVRDLGVDEAVVEHVPAAVLAQALGTSTSLQPPTHNNSSSSGSAKFSSFRGVARAVSTMNVMSKEAFTLRRQSSIAPTTGSAPVPTGSDKKRQQSQRHANSSTPPKVVVGDSEDDDDRYSPLEGDQIRGSGEVDEVSDNDLRSSTRGIGRKRSSTTGGELKVSFDADGGSDSQQQQQRGEEDSSPSPASRLSPAAVVAVPSSDGGSSSFNSFVRNVMRDTQRHTQDHHRGSSSSRSNVLSGADFFAAAAGIGQSLTLSGSDGRSASSSGCFVGSVSNLNLLSDARREEVLRRRALGYLGSMQQRLRRSQEREQRLGLRDKEMEKARLQQQQAAGLIFMTGEGEALARQWLTNLFLAHTFEAVFEQSIGLVLARRALNKLLIPLMMRKFWLRQKNTVLKAAREKKDFKVPGYVDLMKSCPMLSRWPAPQLAKLAAKMTAFGHVTGSHLIFRGEPPVYDSVMFIASGTVLAHSRLSRNALGYLVDGDDGDNQLPDQQRQQHNHHHLEGLAAGAVAQQQRKLLHNSGEGDRGATTSLSSSMKRSGLLSLDSSLNSTISPTHSSGDTPAEKKNREKAFVQATTGATVSPRAAAGVVGGGAAISPAAAAAKQKSATKGGLRTYDEAVLAKEQERFRTSVYRQRKDAVFQKGSIIGVSQVLLGQDFLRSYTCQSDCVVYKITARDFLELMEELPLQVRLESLQLAKAQERERLVHEPKPSADSLRRIPIFGSWPRVALESVVHVMTPLVVQKGEMVCRDVIANKRFIVVHSGEMKLEVLEGGSTTTTSTTAAHQQESTKPSSQQKGNKSNGAADAAAAAAVVDNHKTTDNAAQSHDAVVSGSKPSSSVPQRRSSMTGGLQSHNSALHLQHRHQPVVVKEEFLLVGDTIGADIVAMLQPHYAEHTQRLTATTFLELWTVARADLIQIINRDKLGPPLRAMIIRNIVPKIPKPTAEELRTSDVLGFLSERIATRVCAVMKPVTTLPGECLVREGSFASVGYLVGVGQALLTRAPNPQQASAHANSNSSAASPSSTAAGGSGAKGQPHTMMVERTLPAGSPICIAETLAEARVSYTLTTPNPAILWTLAREDLMDVLEAVDSNHSVLFTAIEKAEVLSGKKTVDESEDAKVHSALHAEMSERDRAQKEILAAQMRCAKRARRQMETNATAFKSDKERKDMVLQEEHLRRVQERFHQVEVEMRTFAAIRQQLEGDNRDRRTMARGHYLRQPLDDVVPTFDRTNNKHGLLSKPANIHGDGRDNFTAPDVDDVSPSVAVRNEVIEDDNNNPIVATIDADLAHLERLQEQHEAMHPTSLSDDDDEKRAERAAARARREARRQFNLQRQQQQLASNGVDTNAGGSVYTNECTAVGDIEEDQKGGGTMMAAKHVSKEKKKKNKKGAAASKSSSSVSLSLRVHPDGSTSVVEEEESAEQSLLTKQQTSRSAAQKNTNKKKTHADEDVPQVDQRETTSTKEELRLPPLPSITSILERHASTTTTSSNTNTSTTTAAAATMKTTTVNVRGLSGVVVPHPPHAAPDGGDDAIALAELTALTAAPDENSPSNCSKVPSMTRKRSISTMMAATADELLLSGRTAAAAAGEAGDVEFSSSSSSSSSSPSSTEEDPFVGDEGHNRKMTGDAASEKVQDSKEEVDPPTTLTRRKSTIISMDPEALIPPPAGSISTSKPPAAHGSGEGEQQSHQSAAVLPLRRKSSVVSSVPKRPTENTTVVACHPQQQQQQQIHNTVQAPAAASVGVPHPHPPPLPVPPHQVDAVGGNSSGDRGTADHPTPPSSSDVQAKAKAAAAETKKMMRKPVAKPAHPQQRPQRLHATSTAADEFMLLIHDSSSSNNRGVPSASASASFVGPSGASGGRSLTVPPLDMPWTLRQPARRHSLAAAAQQQGPAAAPLRPENAAAANVNGNPSTTEIKMDLQDGDNTTDRNDDIEEKNGHNGDDDHNATATTSAGQEGLVGMPQKQQQEMSTKSKSLPLLFEVSESHALSSQIRAADVKRRIDTLCVPPDVAAQTRRELRHWSHRSVQQQKVKGDQQPSSSSPRMQQQQQQRLPTPPEDRLHPSPLNVSAGVSDPWSSPHPHRHPSFHPHQQLQHNNHGGGAPQSLSLKNAHVRNPFKQQQFNSGRWSKQREERCK